MRVLREFCRKPGRYARTRPTETTGLPLRCTTVSILLYRRSLSLRPSSAKVSKSEGGGGGGGNDDDGTVNY